MKEKEEQTYEIDEPRNKAKSKQVIEEDGNDLEDEYSIPDLSDELVFSMDMDFRISPEPVYRETLKMNQPRSEHAPPVVRIFLKMDTHYRHDGQVFFSC